MLNTKDLSFILKRQKMETLLIREQFLINIDHQEMKIRDLRLKSRLNLVTRFTLLERFKKGLSWNYLLSYLDLQQDVS